MTPEPGLMQGLTAEARRLEALAMAIGARREAIARILERLLTVPNSPSFGRFARARFAA